MTFQELRCWKMINKQEAIEKIKSKKISNKFLSNYGLGYNEALDEASYIINQIDELKPVVPKFVADWIEDHKGDYSKWDEEARADFVFRAINDLFRFGDGLNPWDFTIYEEFSKWTTENAYEFITAILFDYTVKKEKLYTVEIPNPNSAGGKTVLSKQQSTGRLILQMLNSDINKPKYLHLTESEIKQDFAWAWQFAKEVGE